MTSYADALATSEVNQVQSAYNTFQQLIIEYQEHSGAVNTLTTPSIDYTYADGKRQHGSADEYQLPLRPRDLFHLW